ncbi:MAG TPA: twin-arginine translocation signal domain-containing protein [Chloroflexota bacterium]|nr:twin-arginine translocation signal domain-containing protein [Chloroflexota bacterium]
MDEPNGKPQDQPDGSTPRSIGRRQLLKALGATAGTFAAMAFLPDRWVKPAVAQVAGFRIDDLSVSEGVVGFAYHDLQHEVDDSTTWMHAEVDSASGQIINTQYNSLQNLRAQLGVRRHGGPAGGSIQFFLNGLTPNGLPQCGVNSSWNLGIYLRAGATNASWRYSNTLNTHICQA